MSTRSIHEEPTRARSERIRRVVSGYARSRGQGGSSRLEAILAEHPDLMPELGEALEKMRRIEGALDEVEDGRYSVALARLAIDGRGSSADEEFEAGLEQAGDGDSTNTLNRRSGSSDGATAAAVDDPIPAAIARYRVRHLLGEGAFGRVYLAWDEELAREVAVKVSHTDQESSPQSVEVFLMEARTLARLDHPCIVPVYDAGRTEDGSCYVVSKWICGSDLQLRMERENLPVEETLRIVTSVAGALHHAHEHGLIHRDVKPANILLDGRAAPYLGDFGLALSGKRLSNGRCFAGTPAYMSPEQARGEAHRVDARSDVFSLGVVLYELITGTKPFRADSRAALLRKVMEAEPPAPRQIDPTISPELERICLKALAKRAADRYRSALELADDLAHFAEILGRQRALNAKAGQRRSPLLVTKPGGEPPAPKIVPRGLRPFEACDSKSFLPLVPGPRDRDGLPESIRQWKIRIEQEDPEESFPVGVLYGPSGCGKSSLVRAGLIPRLSTHVHTVYVEAAAERTEQRVRRKLVRRYPELPADGDLTGCLAALRCGDGPAKGAKLLLVIDQFEQWLHGRSEPQRREMVEALRHCDGSRLQCLLLVRDDFWLALSRFMMELEVDLVQRHNTGLVDLFDVGHARKVLAEFGRAYGQLPGDLSRLTSAHESFLQRAVDGLAEGDRIVPARLALFAEMVKAKPWNPTTLRDVGGPDGVGVSFLEETFNVRTSNPQYRVHEQAARAVLDALMPESGSEIKGRVRSYPELLDLSGYGKKPRAFKELVRILDSETRLITPCDPEVASVEDSTVRAGLRYYQLTHDYLVPALRRWLTRKQKATRSGRWELRLADRSAMWSATGERRQLPSLWEWCSIRLLTRSHAWTDSQRRMMRSAGRYYTFTGGVLAAVLMMFLFSGLELTGMTRDLLTQFRARSAVAWMAVRYDEAVWPLLEHKPDPTLRTGVIHGLNQLVARPEAVLENVDEQEDVSVRRGMLLVAGHLLGKRREPFGVRRDDLGVPAIDRLVSLYKDDPDPGIHSAAEWLLRHCGRPDRIATSVGDMVSPAPRGDRQWYVNGQGHTMIGVPGPARFLLVEADGFDSKRVGRRRHYQRIRRGFSIASTETTVEQYRRFLEDNPWARQDSVSSSTTLPGGPQTSVTWYEAAAYCNWLSEKTGLLPDEWCYVRNDALEYAAGMRLADDYLDRRGYRLPTEAEWEYACRAGAETAFSFGADPDYLEHYAVSRDDSGGELAEVRTKMPNDFGLFDMHGNAAEWCQDPHRPYRVSETDSSVSHVDVTEPVENRTERVIRGGSSADPPERLHCAARQKSAPDRRHPQCGFRVARTYP